MLLKKRTYGYYDMVTMSFKTSSLYSGIYLLQTLVSALMPTLSVIATARFLNVAAAVFNKEAPLYSVYVPVAFLAGIMVYNAFINVLINMIECRRAIYFRKKLVPEIISIQAGLEFRHIENPQTADLISRVCPSFEVHVWDMYKRVLEVVNLVVYVTGIMAFLFKQIWWVALIMFFAGIPVLYIATKAGQHSYDAGRDMSKIDRRVNYLSTVLKSREAVEERSVYGYTERLNKQYSDNYDFARKKRLKIMRGNMIKEKLGGIVTTAYSVGAMLAMLPFVVRGKMDYGTFVALIGGIFGLTDKLSWGINDLVENLAGKREYLKDLTEFMKLEGHDDAADIPKQNMTFNTIEFVDVSFQYPDTEKRILDHVSFKIEKGRHYSFVGANGAGKTTITKLILGLYTNYEGEIRIDGRSLRDLSQAEIKGLSSVMYQDFARYYISLYDNIAVADQHNIGSVEKSREVKNAVELVGLGAVVRRLKNGLDTPLGKVMEKGTDLSGGEWQRVAMARSIMNNAPFKILDEPTAALDPIGESMIYHSFEQISKGMTTIFISHRLGSTKLADTIFVLSRGKIIESGTHAELMAEDGVYCEMFNSQADWYRDTQIVGEEMAQHA